MLAHRAHEPEWTTPRRRNPGSRRFWKMDSCRGAKALIRSFLHDQGRRYRLGTTHCGANRGKAQGSSAVQTRNGSRDNFRDRIAAHKISDRQKVSRINLAMKRRATSVAT